MGGIILLTGGALFLFVLALIFGGTDTGNRLSDGFSPYEIVVRDSMRYQQQDGFSAFQIVFIVALIGSLLLLIPSG